MSTNKSVHNAGMDKFAHEAVFLPHCPFLPDSHDKRMSKQKMNDTANTGFKGVKALRNNGKLIDNKQKKA